ncbi:MAG: acetoin utilization protein AcuC [Candidatus Heimdallarchaeota archaeon]|nr:MAG: acetoin utilization protein AcuC [Candidatus Heimdallarchaeota archaeon]
MTKTGIVWSDKYIEYNLGEGHPMNPKRLIVPYQLFKSLLFHLPEIQVFSPHPASDDEILLYHSPKYLEAMKALSNAGGGARLRLGLGTGDCPVFPGMHEASCLVIGGALEGVNRILNGDVKQAFALLGGLHHAFEERAAGFCYYNDVVIAINYLRKHHGYDRVLYLDTDVHHGDGVLAAFYEDKSVLGISLHESGRFIFPGTGHNDEIGKDNGLGYTINIPFFPGTWDDLYIQTFEDIIPCLWEEFDPEFVIWQCGADGHFKDVLGHLTLTTKTYSYLGQRINELSQKGSADGRLLLLGGGGYNPDSVARVWLATVAGIAGIKLPKESPPEWIEFCQENFNLEVSPLLEDTIDPKKIDRHPFIEEEISEATQEALQFLKNLLKDVPAWKNCNLHP